MRYEKSQDQDGPYGTGYVTRRISKKVGATRQTIGLIEAGRYNPSIKLCINICIALHKHLDDLFWDASYDKEEWE